jgi:hypothetical protein
MVQLSIEQIKSWDIFVNKIPLNTFKFLNKSIQEKYQELTDLESFLRKEPNYPEKRARVDLLGRRILEENQILASHHTIVVPPDQSQFCSMGTAVLVNIAGRKKWLIPDVCVTSANTISFNNPLCKAILGKEKFEEGSYKNMSTDQEVKFQILDILTYSQTKRKFFAKKEEGKEKVNVQPTQLMNQAS